MTVRFFFTIIFLLLFGKILFANPKPPPVCAVDEFRLLEGFQTTPNTIRFPFRLVGRLIVVRAAINGDNGYFIVDTGADKLVLNAKHYTGVTYSAQQVAVSVTGEIGDLKKTVVDSMNWDQLLFEDFFADVVDLSHIEKNKNIKIMGLIGNGVLKDYQVLLDYRERQVVLTKTDDQGEPLDKDPYFESAFDSLSFDFRNEVIVLTTKVGEYEMDVALDSGAELNLIDRYVKKGVLKHFTIKKRVKLTGVENRKLEVVAGEMGNVQIGNVLCPPMRTLLTNLTDMNRSYGTSLKGLIGYEFLGKRRTIINFKKQKLYFLAWAKA